MARKKNTTATAPTALAAFRPVDALRDEEIEPRAGEQLMLPWKASSRPFIPSRPRVDSSEAGVAFLAPLAEECCECFVVLSLDTRGGLIAKTEVSRGTLTACPVHPREVFRTAIQLGAASLVLAHNHPSGDPEPSGEDLSLTRRLCRAGALLGIPVVDHLILGERGSFVSLAQRGVVG